MAKLNVGSINLSDFDKDWFLVVSKLMERSVRANFSRPKTFAIAHRTIPIKPTVVKKTVFLDTFFRKLLEQF